jgi:hypothetical protein
MCKCSWKDGGKSDDSSLAERAVVQSNAVCLNKPGYNLK